MLKALWEWLWKPREQRWTLLEMQRRVLALEAEWGDFLDISLAREDRDRKRRMKALKDAQEPPEVTQEGAVPTKNDLRARLRLKTQGRGVG